MFKGLFSFEELNEQGDLVLEECVETTSSPIHHAVSDAFKDTLAKEIDGLPEREKMVLSLYYEEELNLKEIGLVLSVSESRVSQIHAQAAMRLKSRLVQWV